jgi:plasmid stabilization system protein ParE
MDRRVIFAPTSIRDLADSVSYISRFDPNAAARLGDSLIEAAERMLGQHPLAGPVCPEYPEGPYRYWLHKGYRIVYQISKTEDQVEILRFWHCAQGDVPLPKE